MITYKKLSKIDYNSFILFCTFLNEYRDRTEYKFNNSVWGTYSYVDYNDGKKELKRINNTIKTVKKYMNNNDGFYFDSLCFGGNKPIFNKVLSELIEAYYEKSYI